MKKREEISTKREDFPGEEEVVEDMDLERTRRRGENVDGVMRTEGQKIVEDWEMPGMWGDFGSVRSEREHVPITQELPMIDSVSSFD